ncbi:MULTISPECIES: AI-2E family transporter [unclassified Mesorhizobium]|uniref:AI-2E family transporter n=1 Tax=unclassified Mesorhizobium TaxID=325217 RepID=UPI002417CEA1|nr:MULTISPECIES: AI-2E family transporter [unclassified Mesorhizobium]MDG4903507.1 AI-2E family transporter [Mesorhizobium sp. WSM4962]MDG4921443.1 AI-2E family transporter [Mesorhizobium sp. WSM4989]
MVFDLSVERILGIGAVVLLGIGCIVVLWPFLSALIWAAVLCFSTWPIYTWLERLLGGRRTPAALLMTLLVAAVIVAPFAVLVATLADSVATVAQSVNSLLEQGPPAPPGWVAEIPFIGERLALYWQGLAYNAPAFLVELTKLIRPATDIAVASGAVLGVGLLELALSVFIAFFFYRYGRQMAASVRGGSERIGGTRARHLLAVAGSTVTGVVYGVIGTAIAQGALAGLGFWIAGVPQALLLGFLTFLLSFVPAAPPVVWGSAALWLFFRGEVGWGIFVATWGLLLVSSIDNLLRPYLLTQANSLPVLLSFFGFLGGILAFGFIGVFLGPVLLAVGYSLFLEWQATGGQKGSPPGE